MRAVYGEKVEAISAYYNSVSSEEIDNELN